LPAWTCGIRPAGVLADIAAVHPRAGRCRRTGQHDACSPTVSADAQAWRSARTPARPAAPLRSATGDRRS